VITDGTKCHDGNSVGQSGCPQDPHHSWHLQMMHRSCARHSVFQSSGETALHSAVLERTILVLKMLLLTKNVFGLNQDDIFATEAIKKPFPKKREKERTLEPNLFDDNIDIFADLTVKPKEKPKKKVTARLNCVNSGWSVGTLLKRTLLITSI